MRASLHQRCFDARLSIEWVWNTVLQSIDFCLLPNPLFPEVLQQIRSCCPSFEEKSLWAVTVLWPTKSQFQLRLLILCLLWHMFFCRLWVHLLFQQYHSQVYCLSAVALGWACFILHKTRRGTVMFVCLLSGLVNCMHVPSVGLFTITGFTCG